jgi:hypothetical protein
LSHPWVFQVVQPSNVQMVKLASFTLLLIGESTLCSSGTGVCQRTTVKDMSYSNYLKSLMASQSSLCRHIMFTFLYKIKDCDNFLSILQLEKRTSPHSSRQYWWYNLLVNISFWVLKLSLASTINIISVATATFVATHISLLATTSWSTLLSIRVSAISST